VSLPGDGESAPGLRSLRPGEALGRYQIRGLLGVGGMGRVYRAFDPVLQREVAIKALAGPFREDPASLRRVAREARLLATLNHPNVAIIHGLEPLDGVPHLVLELVEGETLAEQLARGPLPQPAALAVAVQVAAALEEAHRKGIVHRDLKPANVKVDPEGRVKVLDFGIAVALSPAGPEASAEGPLTRPNVIPGTAPYMSPEQVRGQPVDTRSDVWSFGCMLFEMLSGAPVFAGASAPEVTAAVLRDPIHWERLPPGTLPAVRRVLDRCLRRERRERLQAIGDARLELSEAAAGEGSEPWRPARRRSWPWAAAALALLGALAGLLWRPAASPPPPRLLQLGLDLPAGLEVAGGFAAPFAVSPDGTRVAVVALKGSSRLLVVRRLDRPEVRELPGTAGAWLPTFSPDGERLAFFADRKLKTVPVDGGPVVVVTEIGANPRGAAWLPDGRLVFAPTQACELWAVPAVGGPATPLTTLDLSRGEGSHRWPEALPGGRRLLFTTGLESTSFDDARIELLDLPSGERRVLVEGATHGRYAAGHLLYVRSGRLLAAPFEPGAGAVSGPPALLVEDVRTDPRNGGAHFAAAGSQLLIYGSGPEKPPEYHLAWVDAEGRLARVPGPARRFRDPRLSPDGKRIAVVVGPAGSADLWLVDAATGAADRLTQGLSPWRPTWTPDGRGITVGVRVAGRWRLDTLPAGGGPPTAVLESEHAVYPGAWTPDGRRLVFQERRPATGWDLREVEVGTGGRAAGPARDLLATPFEERNPALSADGRRLAFESNELDGVNGVYVAELGTPGAKLRATSTPGNWPRWGTGNALHYWYPAQMRPGEFVDPDGIYRLEWRPASGAAGPPRPSWPPLRATAERIVLGPFAPFDVDRSAPEPRFLVLETSATRLEPALTAPVVVLGWQELLRQGGAGGR